MLKLSYYVPESDHEAVKAALFKIGLGRLGDYDQVCWQVLGTGQFRPLAGANPAVGAEGKLETLPEYRVEMLCDEALVEQAIETLIAAHPYEEPAYEVVALQYPR